MPTSPADSVPFRLQGVSGIEQVCQLTGPDAVVDTEPVKIAGTDLGSMFDAGGQDAGSRSATHSANVRKG